MATIRKAYGSANKGLPELTRAELGGTDAAVLGSP